MKPSIIALSLTLLVGSVAQATFIDDFSADTSAKYTTLCTWDPGGGASTYGRNAENQFAPAGGYGATTLWFRNDGLLLNVGNSVSVDLCNIAYVEGLVLSKSLTQFANTPGSTAAMGVFNTAGSYTGTYKFIADAPDGTSRFSQDGVVADAATTAAPITLTFTRTSDTAATLNYHYWSDGVAQEVSTTISGLTAGAYYFGMVSNPASNSAVFDNLRLSSVPEPSTIMLLITGVLGLLAYAWRKRK